MTTRVCEVEGCDREHSARGMCHRHWSAWRRLNGPPCEGPRCQAVATNQGLCPAHRWQLRNGIDPLRPLRTDRLPCEVEDCDRVSTISGYCRKHDYRLKQNGDPLALRRADKGEGTINKNGYRQYSLNGFPVYEHRYVMEQHIGRALLDHENVHHKNGDRLDNRISNLELWSKSQPPGQRVEDKVEWAAEILGLYAPERLSVVPQWLASA